MVISWVAAERRHRRRCAGIMPARFMFCLEAGYRPPWPDNSDKPSLVGFSDKLKFVGH
jgi:hypothetical protein